MELVVLGLIVVFIYAFIRLLASFSTWMTGTRYRAYRQLAHRYSGRYESRGISDPPTVSFQHHGTAVRVGLAPTIPGQPTSPRTRVVARFRSGIPFRLELAPVTRPAPLQAPKGTRLVKTNDPEFDRAVLVQANDAEMARDFLNPLVRNAIGNLQRLVHPGGMLVSINPERLLVQIDRNLGQSTEALTQAVSESLAIHDGLQLGVSRRMRQGITIVDNPGLAAEDLGPPVCKVCAGLIDGGAIVVCSSCRTPHHRDCWEYVGACSIYGCGCKLGEPIAGS
jgi:Prokaryotic RING finger family 1